MLNRSTLIGFVATTQPAEARRFYEHSLGLELLEESPFALVFASGGNTVRVQKVQAVATPPYTSLGWAVDDIAATVRQLGSRGVTFQRYEGLPQNDEGIWRTPDGSQVAWFRDPDGNTLSLTQYAAQ
jgi:catechol 2,3-dioxygenase-like lactoylglutathione lyase family enzyme